MFYNEKLQVSKLGKFKDTLGVKKVTDIMLLRQRNAV